MIYMLSLSSKNNDIKKQERLHNLIKLWSLLFIQLASLFSKLIAVYHKYGIGKKQFSIFPKGTK